MINKWRDAVLRGADGENISCSIVVVRTPGQEECGELAYKEALNRDW